MAEPLLAISGLDAGYGDVQVLWGIGLEVPRGEISCLVGSNGAGKTTLLRAISGQVEVRGGSIAFDGRALAGASPAQVLEAGIAHVPEGRRLFSAMSVRDNLLMGAYLRRDGKAAIEADLEKAFAMFPILRQRFAQDAGTLSGGEQQMCAIARALMALPTLLMLDEPSLGLAPRVVQEVFGIITAVHGLGVAVLLVEQNVRQALAASERGYVLENGRVVLEGTGSELLASEATQRAYLGR